MMRAARFTVATRLHRHPCRCATRCASWPTASTSSRPSGCATSSSKLLLADDPRPGLELLVETGLADRILPELPALRLEIDEHHPDHQHKNVYTHSLTVLEQAI